MSCNECEYPILSSPTPGPAKVWTPDTISQNLYISIPSWQTSNGYIEFEVYTPTSNTGANQLYDSPDTGTRKNLAVVGGLLATSSSEGITYTIDGNTVLIGDPFPFGQRILIRSTTNNSELIVTTFGARFNGGSPFIPAQFSSIRLIDTDDPNNNREYPLSISSPTRPTTRDLVQVLGDGSNTATIVAGSGDIWVERQ